MNQAQSFPYYLIDCSAEDGEKHAGVLLRQVKCLIEEAANGRCSGDRSISATMPISFAIPTGTTGAAWNIMCAEDRDRARVAIAQDSRLQINIANG